MRDLWTLRLSGLPHAIGPDMLKSTLERFGEIIHVNHSKAGSETIVVYCSRDAAEAADKFIEENGFQAIPGVQSIIDARSGAGRGQVFMRMDHSSEPPKSETDDVGGHNDHYWEGLQALIHAMEGVFDDNSYFEHMQMDFTRLKERKSSQQDLCRFLLDVGQHLQNQGNVVSDPDAMRMWLATMQLFADGELSQHCDRFADTSVNELLTCLDTNLGNLSGAWADTE
jgi:hypothetical protein